MILGILLIIIYLLLVSIVIFRRSKNKRFNNYYLKMHKVLGFVFPLIAIGHLILSLPLLKQRPTSMVITGYILLGISLLLILTYLYRKTMKINFFKLKTISTILLGILILIHGFIGIRSLNVYKNKIQEIELITIDYSNLEDGDYIGSADVGYIYVKVSVTIKDKLIQSIELIEHLNEKGKPAEEVINTIIKDQEVNVNPVTGATNSSKVIMKAVQNALDGTKEVK